MIMLELVGVAIMWVVILLRIPLVINHKNQLPQWSAITLVAITITLYIRDVNKVLSQLLTPYVVYLGTHLITLINSAAVLHFVLTISQRKNYTRPLLAATTVTAIVIVWIYVIVDPKDPHPARVLDLPLAYWLLISGFRIATLVYCTALCWYGSLRTDHWSMRAGLITFGLGLLITALPAAMNFGWLYTRDPIWKEYFPAIDGIAALCITVGASLPLTPAAARGVADLLAYRQLRPLWLALVNTFPDVRLNYFENGVERRPLFLPLNFRLYRRIIEIRDAMLLLRHYVCADAVERAQRHVMSHSAPGTQAEATITACCLAVAQWCKVQEKKPRALVANLPDQGHDDLKSEVVFLSQVAHAYFSPVVQRYVIDLSEDLSALNCCD